MSSIRLLGAAAALAVGGVASVVLSSARREDAPAKPSQAVGSFTLECGPPQGAVTARITVETPQVFAFPATPAEGPSAAAALYVVHLAWAWQPLDEGAGYRRVTLGLTTAAGMVLDLYPRGVNAPLPVDAALALEGQRRLRVVPRGPDTLPLDPSTQRVSGRMHGTWAFWSAAHEAVTPGRAGAYALIYVPAGLTQLDLHLRLRAEVGTWLFGKLRPRCKAATPDRTLSLPLPPPSPAAGRPASG